jgi:hypothetical protein
MSKSTWNHVSSPEVLDWFFVSLQFRDESSYGAIESGDRHISWYLLTLVESEQT